MFPLPPDREIEMYIGADVGRKPLAQMPPWFGRKAHAPLPPAWWSIPRDTEFCEAAETRRPNLRLLAWAGFILICALPWLLGACTSDPALPAARDQAGRIVLPPECSPTALAAVSATIVKVPYGSPLLHWDWGSADGKAMPDGHGGGLIIIRDDLAPWYYEDVRRHEACHCLWAKLYPATKGQFHR